MGQGLLFQRERTLVGDVTLGDECSVWFNAVVRGDVAPITIGDRSNVQDGSTAVTINYERIREDARWNGLKGYLTNTDIPTEDVVAAYHNLWNVERAFRIAKSKIEIRPMFHFTRRRIEAHICICFVALKVYKELERMLKLSGIGMSVDKVLNTAKTVTTISIYMPENKTHLIRTMPMKRHQPIAILFEDEFWKAH